MPNNLSGDALLDAALVSATKLEQCIDVWLQNSPDIRGVRGDWQNPNPPEGWHAIIVLWREGNALVKSDYHYLTLDKDGKWSDKENDANATVTDPAKERGVKCGIWYVNTPPRDWR